MNAFTLALGIFLVATSLAANCGSTTINSAADADALRQSCSTVNGDIKFGIGLNGNVSLDGIEIVNGDVYSDNSCIYWETSCPNQPALTISSSTLTTIHGDFSFSESFSGLVSVGVPRLRTIGGAFLFVTLQNLIQLDITNLDTVGYFHLAAPALKTMRHNTLRNVTGAYGIKDVLVMASNLTSLDSLLSHPMDIGNGTAGFYTYRDMPAPAMTSFTYGFKRAGELYIQAQGNLSLTLGNSATTDMTIDNLYLISGTKELIRSGNLTSLDVGQAFLNGLNQFEELLLPFDSLTNLSVTGEKTIKRLDLPPTAVNYSNFSLLVNECDSLNMTSQFKTDSGGRETQTWYWPEKNITQIWIEGLRG